MPAKPTPKLVDNSFDKNPLDAIRQGLRSAFKIACDAGDASAASIAKTLLELETTRHEANEAVAPVEKKGARFCPSCGQRLAFEDAQQAISFRLVFGGEAAETVREDGNHN